MKFISSVCSTPVLFAALVFAAGAVSTVSTEQKPSVLVVAKAEAAATVNPVSKNEPSSVYGTKSYYPTKTTEVIKKPVYDTKAVTSAVSKDVIYSKEPVVKKVSLDYIPKKVYVEQDEKNIERSYSTKTPTCNYFRVVERRVDAGETIMLKWETTDVTRVSVNQGVGGLSVDGTTIVKAPTKPGVYEYVLTFDGKTSDRCRDTLEVEKASVPTSLTCSGVSFSASDTTVTEGDRVTLDWSWTQAYDRVRISNGIGTVRNHDSERVTINDDEQFTLLVSKDGQSKDCKTISIKARDEDRGKSRSGSSTPRCEAFTVSGDTVTAGDRVVLRWETSRTDELALYEGSVRRGDKIFSTDDEDMVEDGEFVVRPTKDTTYTLYLERGSRDRTCTVDVAVDDEVVVLTSTTQDPRVAGIAISEAPYTGFTDSSVFRTIFYALLAGWGAFVFYSLRSKRRQQPVLTTRAATG